MPDYQPIDYRLRCHTKRTDLPVDVLRDIGEAYEYINDLQRRIQMLRDGFEGSCTACEPVGDMNKKLREERDEARRILNEIDCRIEHGAESNGHLEAIYNMFKENNNA